MSLRTLVIDDDIAPAGMTDIVLQSEGYEVVSCVDGSAALTQFQGHNPDLVPLDVMLPGADGFDVCRVIRHVSDAPIVVLTTCSDTSDVVMGLKADADDYVPKPFKLKEPVACVRTRLRGHKNSQADESLSLQDLSIDVAGHAARREGRTIAPTPLELDLLATLARSPWKVFSREKLLEQVWGYRHATDTRLVNVHVQHLHSEIGRDSERLELVATAHGVGHRTGVRAQRRV